MEMYRKVIEEPLELPKFPSDKYTCSMLSGLLEKESDRRLGWGQDGIQEIKSHPYFATIDWHLLNRKYYSAPSMYQSIFSSSRGPFY
ncbi:hypothetical protein BY458DRAFT_504471 [Sporodiniella umbellata]|nr:hypothetical protein BY458DRAFT_504471 [Sporodiniella umbellata]